MSKIETMDVMDLRDLSTFARELDDLREEWDQEDQDDATELIRFARELTNRDGIETLDDAADAIQEIGDGYEPTLIREDHFTMYAEELAEELDLIKPDAAWPARHIDWEAAADELRTDYTSVTLNGHDYLIRAW